MAFNYKDPRWQKRRLEIMERDGFACMCCGDKESELHVHHKRYKGQPWETKDDDMQTLCVKCHTALGPHPKAGIWYDEDGWSETTRTLRITHCPQCRKNDWFVSGYMKRINCTAEGCDYCLPYLPQCLAYVFNNMIIDPCIVYDPELLIEISKEVQNA